MWRQFLGSTIALGIGWLLFLGGCGAMLNSIQDPTTETNLHAFVGLQVAFGVLAYRSAKRTTLGLREKSWDRTLLEIAALIFVWHPTILLGIGLLTGFLTQTYILNLLHEFYEKPTVPWTEYLITPTWTLISYISIRRKNTNNVQ